MTKFLCCPECGNRKLTTSFEAAKKKSIPNIYRYCSKCGTKFLDPDCMVRQINDMQKDGTELFKRTLTISIAIFTFVVYILLILLTDRIVGIIISAVLAAASIAAVAATAVIKRIKYNASMSLREDYSITVARMHQFHSEK